jgi:signal transduction histidine kinase
MRYQAVLDAEVEARANEVRSVREVRATAAATQERLRLARELHDVVAHHVVVMVVQAGAARRTVESGRDGADTALASVASTGDAVLEELAQLLALVDPGTRGRGEGHGMGKLEELVDRVRASGLPVDLRVIGDRRSLPGGLDLVAHRIVQESLTNVIRHAGARRARVRVTYLPDRLTLEITDDGRGLGAGPQSGLGVTGMRERAQMYGGRCELSPSADGGVRVRATLPLELAGEPV